MTKRKVNVLSNELDQAPKTRAAGYGKVVDSMRKEINKAMDGIILIGSDVLANYMNDSNNRIPVDLLLNLKPGDHLSFEVKRNKIKQGGFRGTVGHYAFKLDCHNFRHNCYRFEEEGPLKPGETSTIIVVEKDLNDPKLWKIHAEQVEYPRESTMLEKGILFHNPDVDDEKFQNIIGRKYE